MNKKNTSKIKINLAILGGGPAGYTAAFRASDLNINTIIIEKTTKLGGVCLNDGCIPTKSLLYASNYITETKIFNQIGIYNEIKDIDIKKIQQWKNSIIDKIQKNLTNLSKKRNIKIINGYGKFITQNLLEVNSNDKKITIEFNNAIIASGSNEKTFIKNKKHINILTSSQALNLNYIPKKILIIGAGFVGMELATIFSSFGSNIDIIEKSNDFLPMFDKDITDIYIKNIKKQINNIYFKTTIIKITKKNTHLSVLFNNKCKKEYNIIIYTTGRYGNITNLNLDKIGINLTTNNFIKINDKGQTNIKNIYACGDVTGFPMLAHKAIHQAKIIAEIIGNYNYSIQNKCTPIILYTNPEIAQVGINENLAKKLNIKYNVGKFPWHANAKALIINSSDGVSKLIFNEEKRIIGGCIIGKHANELISELSLAIEMGSHENDISLTIHPHPTLSETISSASEMHKKTIIDLYIK